MINKTTERMLKLYQRFLEESKKFLQVIEHGGSSAELKTVRSERDTIDRQLNRLKKTGRQ